VQQAAFIITWHFRIQAHLNSDKLILILVNWFFGVYCVLHCRLGAQDGNNSSSVVPKRTVCLVNIDDFALCFSSHFVENFT
jgi:hypothetical protein